jgi:SulP family sulfate permease
MPGLALRDFPRPRRGDAWGGLAAMLVALPAAIGFGVTVFAAIGPGYAALGAFAGIVGTVAIAVVASALGGTDRLVSAPCAPAAAVLSAFAIEMAGRGDEPVVIVVMLLVVGALAGLTQVLLGLVGVGRLIKYIPYPVVSGYLTGVGLLIIASQVPKLLGAPSDLALWASLTAPERWDWRAIAIGSVTAAAVIAAPRFSPRTPSTILGILAGMAVYVAFAARDPALRQVAGNGLVLGPLGGSFGGLVDSLGERWGIAARLDAHRLVGLLGSALTLAALLSIDTLKTCVVLDKLTRTRHDSDRELVAQGFANLASSACGGIPGAGTMGATLVGLASGARTRATGLMQGLFALAAALALGAFIAWIPVATLAGILVAIGLRMIDREPLRFVRSRATVLDFLVVVSVVVVAITVGLIAASAVGVILAMVLFVREQSGGSVVRHKLELGQAPSTWHRPEAEMEVLARKSSQAVIFELQGTLFFGNTYQLYSDLEHEIRTRRYVIIDLKRVQSIDVTAAQAFNQVRDTIQERGARLLLSGAQGNRPNGESLRRFLGQMGLLDSENGTVRLFPDLDSAIAWVEARLLRDVELPPADEPPLALREMELFAGYKEETLADLEACMPVRKFAAGQTLYARGSPGDELFWVRRGSVRLMASLGEKGSKQLAAFGRGDYFGGLAFLDNEPRPNDAVAVTDTEVYVLARPAFEQIAVRHKKLAFNLANAMARTLARRLRRTQLKLVTLEEY